MTCAQATPDIRNVIIIITQLAIKHALRCYLFTLLRLLLLGGFLEKSESDDVLNENKEKVGEEIFNSFSFNFEDEKTYTK